MIIRLLVVLLAASLITIQVIRNAAVEMLTATRPAQAASLWSDHPAVELSLAMTQFAEAAHGRRPVPKSAFAMIGNAALKEPLASEPFVVRGVQAELAGDRATAQRAFEAAQWRDPRSLPAAYFLAERYFRIGNVSEGLNEIAAVARLSPKGNLLMAPYLAAYARDQRNWPALRRLFRANPKLADTALSVLAANAAAAPVVVALADRREKLQDAHWLPPLLSSLTTSGHFAEARALWQRMTGIRATGLIYDASFRDKSSPPPFNWSLTSSAVGVAERQAGGRLHILFYGQEDGILGTELLLLEPGAYRLSMELFGDRERARSLNWSIWCDKAELPIASVSLDWAAASGWVFAVPADCPAQWLKLSGVSGKVPDKIDVSVGALKLERLSPSAQ